MEPLKTLIGLALASTVTAVHAAVPKVAVFDFEFVDTSVEGATNGPCSDEGRGSRGSTVKCGSDWRSPGADR